MVCVFECLNIVTSVIVDIPPLLMKIKKILIFLIFMCIKLYQILFRNYRTICNVSLCLREFITQKVNYKLNMLYMTLRVTTGGGGGQGHLE